MAAFRKIGAVLDSSESPWLKNATSSPKNKKPLTENTDTQTVTTTKMKANRRCIYGRCNGDGRTYVPPDSERGMVAVRLCECYWRAQRVRKWGIKFENSSFYLPQKHEPKAWKMAKEYAKKLIQGKLGNCPHLALLGGIGTWKTSSLVAVWDSVNRCRQSFRAEAWRFPDLLGVLRDVNPVKAGEKSPSEYTLETLRGVDLLLLDDIGADEKSPTPHVLSCMYRLLRHRSDNDLPTVITTNLEIGELEAYLGERVWDGLAANAALVSCTGKNLRREKS